MSPVIAQSGCYLITHDVSQYHPSQLSYFSAIYGNPMKVVPVHHAISTRLKGDRHESTN